MAVEKKMTYKRPEPHVESIVYDDPGFDIIEERLIGRITFGDFGPAPIVAAFTAVGEHVEKHKHHDLLPMTIAFAIEGERFRLVVDTTTDKP